VNVVVPFSLIHDHFKMDEVVFRNLNPSLKTNYIPYMGRPFVFRLPKKEARNFRLKKDSIMYWLTAAPIKPMQYDTLIEVLENNDTVTIIKSAEELEEEESTLDSKSSFSKEDLGYI